MNFSSLFEDVLDDFVSTVGENVIEQLGFDKMSDRELVKTFDTLENYFNTYDADDDEYQENVQIKSIVEIYLRARGYRSKTNWS